MKTAKNGQAAILAVAPGSALGDLKNWIQAAMKTTGADNFGLGQFEGMAMVCDEIDRRLRSPNT